MRPLDGIRVVDVTEGAQGPYAASLLADLGAEVVKLERPGGEMMRSSGPFIGGLALPCLTICHGRTACVTLDLKDRDAMAGVRALVACADLFVQNWKIGTDEKLSLDFAACVALNPHLIYVRSSGFGGEGPYAREGSMDMLSQAASGMASLSGLAGTAGERARTPVLDFVSAFTCAEAAMLGLAARARSGTAQFVDTSQLASALDAMGPEVAAARHGPLGPAEGRSRHTCGGFFATADGQWLAVECVTAQHEAGLAAAFPGAADHGVLVAAVAEQTMTDACATLARHGVPHAKVVRHFDASAIERRPGNLQRYIDATAGEIRFPEAPWIFSGTPVRAGAPLGPPGRDDAAFPALRRRWQAAHAQRGAAA